MWRLVGGTCQGRDAFLELFGNLDRRRAHGVTKVPPGPRGARAVAFESGGEDPNSHRNRPRSGPHRVFEH
jgi:hypothetical protein